MWSVSNPRSACPFSTSAAVPQVVYKEHIYQQIVALMDQAAVPLLTNVQLAIPGQLRLRAHS